MPEDLTTVLTWTAIILVAAAAWVGTLAFVFWDTTERQLSGWKQLLWLLLALVPLLGLLVYLLVRRPPETKSVPFVASWDEARERMTYYRPPVDGAARRLPTIPGVEYRPAERPRGQLDLTQQVEEPAPGRPVEIPAWSVAVVEGPHAGQRFALDRLPACIGRGAGCAIRLDHDRSVSRRHAEFYRQAGRLRLRDLDSTHGTLVNGYKIDDKALQVGDKIRAGYSVLILKREREQT